MSRLQAKNLAAIEAEMSAEAAEPATAAETEVKAE
jgi:hypothetical protein